MFGANDAPQVPAIKSTSLSRLTGGHNFHGGLRMVRIETNLASWVTRLPFGRTIVDGGPDFQLVVIRTFILEP